MEIFDIKNSVDKNDCRYSKITGIPFQRIKAKFNDCVLVTDSKKDCIGAQLAKIPYIQVRPRSLQEPALLSPKSRSPSLFMFFKV
jgi:hypothetical protein